MSGASATFVDIRRFAELDSTNRHALELARDGVPIPALRDEVSSILSTDDVLPGVASLVDMLVVEGQFPEGTKLIVVYDPIRPGEEGLDDDLGPPGGKLRLR